MINLATIRRVTRSKEFEEYKSRGALCLGSWPSKNDMACITKNISSARHRHVKAASLLVGEGGSGGESTLGGVS